VIWADCLFNKILVLVEIHLPPIDVGDAILVKCGYVAWILEQPSPIRAHLVGAAPAMGMDGKSIASASREDWASGVAA